MNNVLQLVRKELKDFFISPVAYVVIGVFLVIVGIIFSINVFVDNQADMRKIFEILPALLILLAAAITMRSWSEERKEGTMEILMSQAIRPVEIIIAKFLSNWLLLMLAVVLTFPIPIILNILGNPDNGVILAGYIGLAIISATYVLIGQFISINSRNQITTFILTVVVIAIIYVLGEAEFLKLIPNGLRGIAEAVGLSSHFRSLTKGVLDSRDLLYFATIIFLMFMFLYKSSERIKKLGK